MNLHYKKCTDCGGEFQWNERKNLWEHEWGSCKGWRKRFPKKAALIGTLFDQKQRSVADVELPA